MSAIDETSRRPEVGSLSAEDRERLQEVFSTLLQRAASNGGSLTRRDIERVRTEFSPEERQRFERYSDVHNNIIAALGGAQDAPAGDGALLEHLVELYAGDVIETLYPELDAVDGAVWREIVLCEIAALMRDWLVPDIDARLEAARRRLHGERGGGIRGEDVVADYEVVAILREANRRLDEELRDGAEFGRVLCLAINDAVRHAFGAAATREMFVGIREADSILDNLVAAQYGNRFRMAVVDPS